MLPIISQARFMTKTRSHHVIPGPAFSRVLLHPKFHNATVAWGERTRDAICTLWVWNQLLKEYTVGRCGYPSMISELVWDAVRFLETHRWGRINSSIYRGRLLESSKSPDALSSQKISSARKVSNPGSPALLGLLNVGASIVKTVFTTVGHPS